MTNSNQTQGSDFKIIVSDSDLYLVSTPKRSFIFCVVFLAGCYVMTIYAGMFNKNFFVFLLEEDGLLENLATLFTLFAAIFFGLAYFRHKSQRSYFFLVLSILLLFVFFEEISWGQRLLDIETPETIRRLNAQEEINFHNFNPIYKYINGVAFVGLDLYLIGIPLLVLLVRNLHGLLLKFRIPIPSPATAFLAFLNYFLFTYFFERYLHHHGKLVQGYINYGEMLEFGIELTLLLFAFECFTRGITCMKSPA
jgi:hypothetical protein